VLTTVFEPAFQAQCQALGFAGAAVYVPHPVQNRTTEELHRFAGESIDRILAMISKPE
jgi:hypothetical protein